MFHSDPRGNKYKSRIQVYFHISLTNDQIQIRSDMVLKEGNLHHIHLWNRMFDFFCYFFYFNFFLIGQFHEFCDIKSKSVLHLHVLSSTHGQYFSKYCPYKGQITSLHILSDRASTTICEKLSPFCSCVQYSTLHENQMINIEDLKLFTCLTLVELKFPKPDRVSSW